MANGITNKEVKGRVGAIMLGIGAWYIATPLRDSINEAFPESSPYVIGLIIIMVSLYFFEL
jgi:hypothetical protein